MIRSFTAIVVIMLQEFDMKSFTILRISGLALAIVALLAATAVAQTTGHHGDHGIPGDDLDDATAFEHMVRGIDTLPNREAMEERWPDALQRLIAVATDTEATEYKRWRATSLLGNFDEPQAEQALLELSDDAEPRIRSMAYYVLGVAFLDEGDEALLEHLKSGLDDSAQRVRADVVRSFGWTENKTAHQVLRQLADDDGDEQLQSIAQRSLERITDR